MIKLINLNYIGARVVCRSGNVYTVAVDGTINVQPVDVQELCEQGYQQNSANPFKLPWSTKTNNFTPSVGSQGFVVVAKDDPATLTVALPPAANSDGFAYFFTPNYAGVGVAGPISIVADADAGDAGDTIDGDPSRGLMVAAIYISDGVNTWHAF
jgi:hypothetical protein